jgi:hypothetical protein
MTLIEKFSAAVLSLKDVKQFIERAETLGYTDRTPIGQVGVGIELYIENPQGAEIYRCGQSGCGKEFAIETMARCFGTAQWHLPAHEQHSRRGFQCEGSGKAGVAQR